MAVSTGGTDAGRSSQGAPSYKPIALRAHVLRWWLWAVVAVDVVVTVLDAIHLSILDADNFAGSDAVLRSDERLAAGGAALFAVFIVATVIWIAWFHRAYRNIDSLDRIGLRFGTGWAIGAWFVPILNLFRPKQIANDIWRATDPDPPQGLAWTSRAVAPIVHWWWASWLVASVLGNVSFRLLGDARTLDEERAAVLVDIAAGISYVVAGLVAIRFVRALTEREARRAAVVTGSESDAERVDREAERRSWPAAVALTLTGAAILVFTVAVAASSMSDSDRNAAGEVSEKRPVGVFELEPGDCLRGLSEASAIRAVEAVPCGRPHTAQVLSSNQLPDGAFPGMRAMYREADRSCNMALRRYAAPKGNAPGPFYLHPTEDSWALGDREIICVAFFEKPYRGRLDAR